MIDAFTLEEIKKAISHPKKYTKGKGRKQLQVTYDKMLDDLSQSLFNEPCMSRMQFRIKINQSEDNKVLSHALLVALRMMLRDQHLLFDSDYKDHLADIEGFLKDSVNDLIEVIENAK